MSRVSLAQRLSRVLVGCGGAVVVSAALGAEAPAPNQASAAIAAADAAAQHRAIATEPTAIERRFNADQQDCQQRFEVNDCLTRASAERRQAMQVLQQRSLQLDDAKRRQRAAQRLQLQQQRRAELAAAAAGSASGVASGREAKAAAVATSAAPRRALRTAPQPILGPDELKAQEQARRAQYDSRQAAAKTHQQVLEERNAEPLRKRPPATALPVPAASTTRP